MKANRRYSQQRNTNDCKNIFFLTSWEKKETEWKNNSLTLSELLEMWMLISNVDSKENETVCNRKVWPGQSFHRLAQKSGWRLLHSCAPCSDFVYVLLHLHCTAHEEQECLDIDFVFAALYFSFFFQSPPFMCTSLSGKAGHVSKECATVHRCETCGESWQCVQLFTH